MGSRGIVAAAVAALVISVMPAASLAAPPLRFSGTQTSLDCILTNEAGTAYVGVGVSDGNEEFGFLGFWPEGTSVFEDPPAWVSDGASVSFSADGTHVLASFDLFELDETSEPPIGAIVGTAVLDASLSVAGPAESFEDSFRDGNRQVRFSGTFQPLAVAGTLTLPQGIVYDDLSECFAGTSTFSVFETNPNAYVSSSDQMFVSCFWEEEGSFIGLSVFNDRSGTFADVFVEDVSGFYFGFDESALLTTTELSASMELTSETTGDPAGSANASATITQGERFSFRDRFGNEMFKVTGRRLLVEGELTLETPLGSRVLPMNDATCYGEDSKVRLIITNPNPGRGPRLANDAPDGAIALTAGDTVTVRTGGTVAPAEEPCVISDPEFEFEVPIGHTVWYTVAGTGGPVTLDTAGSQFDTVVGVYTNGSGFTQVACVDDVFEPEFSLQSRVTIDTAPGETYYFQVGGFAETSGRLEVSVY